MKTQENQYITRYIYKSGNSLAVHSWCCVILQWPWVQALFGNQNSCKLCGVAKKKKKREGRKSMAEAMHLHHVKYKPIKFGLKC